MSLSVSAAAAESHDFRTYVKESTALPEPEDPS